MKLNNILVPTDFSKFSDKAVESAFLIAAQYNAKITLLHSILLFHEEGDNGLQLHEYSEYIKEKENDSRQLLKAHSDSAEEHGVKLETKVLRGFSAADSILEFVKENPVDLVVMGTHGRTGLKKWVYGSVAEKVVRLSPVPVLTTHYFEKPFRIDKILVPVDFSDYSKNAVEYAKELANRFNAELVYLHSIHNEFHPSYFAGGAETLLSLDPKLKDRSMTRLKEFAGNKHKSTCLILEGSAYHNIVDYADNNEIDLIVMATRGLTGLDHYLIGSTTERVVRLAKTPVLTIERTN
ncbi:MAG: universal stress protein [Calditrichaeota bacterium]|nr:universal stress protein [Calditrichota bacterium]